MITSRTSKPSRLRRLRDLRRTSCPLLTFNLAQETTRSGPSPVHGMYEEQRRNSDRSTPIGETWAVWAALPGISSATRIASSFVMIVANEALDHLSFWWPP